MESLDNKAAGLIKLKVLLWTTCADIYVSHQWFGAKFQSL